jgi:transcriptional regulator of aroF, aroG, tyrA and aromatic amino acid transport
MIDMDLFREDLFYRLNVFEIPIPSLRERGTSDITVLAEYFITKFQKKYSRFNLEIPDSFYKEIIKYDWPGNVRELENFIESAIVRADRELCFSKLFENRQLIDKRILSKIKKIKTQELKNQNEISKTFDYILENMTLSSLENSLIVHALNRKMAKPLVAEFLGVSRSTFWRKVKSLGLDLKYSYRE